MEHSRKYSWSLRRAPDGPLAPYVDGFVGRLSGLGYAETSAHPYTRLAADFSRWLKQKNVAKEEITPEHALRYLRYRARNQRPRTGDAAALTRLLDLLTEKGVIAPRRTPSDVTPAQRLLDEYALYLRQERVLASPTRVNYLRFVRSFLAERFGRGRLRLSVLCAADVIRFVQREAAHLSPKVATLLTTALRSFLRYARYRGYIAVDLAAAVPAVANWSMASIPRSIEPDHVRRVLAGCNRQSAVGRRDYAILLLLARLGLRAGEVAGLALEDIDWEAGCLNVRGKGGHRSALPLPADVGEAIAAYLRVGRPASTSRFVFLRAKAPIRGFQSSIAVLSVVRHALARAGIDTPRKGAHQFRHALACEMLRQGASLPDIGQILRHRSPQTTAIYAKVDLASLRSLALPWPGATR
jgi:site-specific recombinase XerD